MPEGGALLVYSGGGEDHFVVKTKSEHTSTMWTGPTVVFAQAQSQKRQATQPLCFTMRLVCLVLVAATKSNYA